jgi:hypothetical protein
MESLLWGCAKSAEACKEGREGRRVMTWLSALLSTESFQMTVSDTRASATLGVQLGVRTRGVAYEDLHQVGNIHDNGPACCSVVLDETVCCWVGTVHQCSHSMPQNMHGHLGELSALLSKSYRAPDWPVPPGFSMAYKPVGVLTEGGGASHILLCSPEGAERGTGACCLGPVLAGLGASGLMEAGGDFCNTDVNLTKDHMVCY